MSSRIVGGGPTDVGAAESALLAAGLSPRAWGNGPGDTYARHEHGYDKVLYCVAGSITFHTDEGDLALQAGDRLEIPAGSGHAATVGPQGCRCVEGGA